MPYVGGVRGYRRILEEVAADGYAGFELRPGRDALQAARSDLDVGELDREPAEWHADGGRAGPP